MQVVEEKKEEIIKYKDENNALLIRANEIIVNNEETYRACGEFRKEVKLRWKSARAFVDKFIVPRKEQANKLHKGLVADEKEIIEPYEKAGKIAQIKSDDYFLEQKQIQEEEARKLMEEAEVKRQQQIGIARKKISNIFNRVSNLDERIQELSSMLEDADEIGAEVINAEITALKAQKEGKLEQANQARAQVEEKSIPEIPSVEQKVEKIDGLSRKKSIEIQIINKGALIREIANKGYFDIVKAFDESAIKNLFKAGVKLQGVNYKEVFKSHVRL